MEIWLTIMSAAKEALGILAGAGGLLKLRQTTDPTVLKVSPSKNGPSKNGKKKAITLSSEENQLIHRGFNIAIRAIALQSGAIDLQSGAADLKSKAIDLDRKRTNLKNEEDSLKDKGNTLNKDADDLARAVQAWGKEVNDYKKRLEAFTAEQKQSEPFANKDRPQTS